MTRNITEISKFDVFEGVVSVSSPKGIWVELKIKGERKLQGFAYYSTLPRGTTLLVSVQNIYADLILLNVDSVLDEFVAA